MKLFLLLVITATSFFASAQSMLVAKANMNSAVGIQQGKLRNAYGFGGAVEVPLKKIKPLKFTTGFDFGINGMKKMPYELDFNGAITETNVHYTSYVWQLSSGLKYIFRDNKKWTPYAAVSAGALSYYTDMAIEDPHDSDGCSPMETKPVLFSMILSGTAETGIRIQPRQRGRGSIAYIEAGAGYVAGTRGKYLRLENNKHDHDEDSYLAKFKYNPTGEVHEHSLGMLYKTTTSMLAFHAALVFRL